MENGGRKETDKKKVCSEGVHHKKKAKRNDRVEQKRTERDRQEEGDKKEKHL